MISELYSRDVLRKTTQVLHQGRLSAPDGTAACTAKLCGSRVTVDVCLDGEVVSDFAIDVKACALGQAASAILSQHVIGAKISDIKAAHEALLLLLAGKEATFPEAFSDLKMFESVKDFPARHASTQLAFEACLKAIEAAKGAKDA